MDVRKQYWEAAEKLFDRFFFPDPELEEKFRKEKEAMMNIYVSEMYYAYVYEPYYVVADLMNWGWEELWGWIEINIDEINRICREVYDDWHDLKRSKDAVRS